MKYKNETNESVMLPIKSVDMPTSWLKFRPGMTLDVPERAINFANQLGLKAVVESQPASISGKPVVTKMVKKKKKK